MEWWMDDEYSKPVPMHYPKLDEGPTKSFKGEPSYDDEKKLYVGGPKIKVFVRRTWASS